MSTGANDFFLGIDAGGTNVKTALFDHAGRLRNSKTISLPASVEQGEGTAERDGDRMWVAVAHAIRELLQSNGLTGNSICAVSITGYGGGLFGIDRHGQAIGMGILSSDSRALEQCQRLAQGSLARLIDETIGIQLWSAWSLPLFTWLSENSHVLVRADKVLWCKDFLRLRLTGVVATDPTDAATAGILDINTGQYATDLLRLTSLDSWIGKLPDIVPSESVAGVVSDEAAMLTGLLQGTPVATGAVDIACCALASGACEVGEVSMVAGTWSINQVVVPSSANLATPPLSNLPYFEPGRRLISYNSATSAGNLTWAFSELITSPGHSSSPAEFISYDTKVDVSLLTERSPMFFPFAFGGPMGARAAILGLSAAQCFPEVLAAMYEGVAFSHRRDSAPIWSFPGVASQINLSGGATRSAKWVQLFADVFDRSVKTDSCQEMGAKGAALLAAVSQSKEESVFKLAASMQGITTLTHPDVLRAGLEKIRFENWMKDIAWLSSRA